MSAEPSNEEAEKLAGALRLLDRDAPAGYLREWTARIAAEQKQADTGTVSVLIFRLGDEWLALSTALFQEVAEGCVLHSLPHRGGGVVAGLVNIRGELLICVSLGAVLGLALGGAGRRVLARLLVTQHEGQRLAFPVDEVAAVQRYHPRELRPLPATVLEGPVRYARGLLPWRDRTVGCLDDEALFRNLNRNLG